jgi:hypothetical protein
VNSDYLIKTYTVFVAEFKKEITRSDGVLDEIEEILYIHCGAEAMDIDTSMVEWFDEMVSSYVHLRIEEFEMNGSGWKLSAI